MRGCLKVITITIGLVLILGAVVSLLLLTQANRSLKERLLESFHEAMPADVHVDGVRVSPIRQEIIISGLSLGNPPNFKTGDALTISKIAVAFDGKTLLTRSPVINRISVDGAQINLQHEVGKGTNLSDLVRLAEKARTTGKNLSRIFTVKEITCNDTKIRVKTNVTPVAAPDITLPRFTITEATQRQFDIASLATNYLQTILSKFSREKVGGKSVAGTS